MGTCKGLCQLGQEETEATLECCFLCFLCCLLFKVRTSWLPLAAGTRRLNAVNLFPRSGGCAVYSRLACLPFCLLLAAQPPAAPQPPGSAAAVQEPLPTGEVIPFLEKCVHRYEQQGLEGYSVILHKQ